MAPPPGQPIGEVPPHVVKTAGPLIVGYLLSWGLYGVLAVQVYIYYLAFPHDRTLSRWLVGIVFLLETAQVVVIANDMFESFAKGFGHPDAITATHLTGFSAPIVAGTVGFLVQLFYAYRIRVLSETRTVPTLVCTMAVIQCVGAWMSGIRGFIGKDVRDLQTMTDRVAHGLFNATSAACDIVIAVAMSYYLPRLNSRVHDSTHILIRRIVRLVIGTGSLTAAVAIIDQILFQACPGTGYFLAPAFVLGKLYSNSMMVLFNSRVDFGPLREETTVNLTTHDVHLTHLGNFGTVRNVYGTHTSSDLGEIDIDIRPQKGDEEHG